jgi:lactate dehydrogenase-like 2-hydroxyacid dehydrogenase
VLAVGAAGSWASSTDLSNWQVSFLDGPDVYDFMAVAHVATDSTSDFLAATTAGLRRLVEGSRWEREWSGQFTDVSEYGTGVVAVGDRLVIWRDGRCLEFDDTFSPRRWQARRVSAGRGRVVGLGSFGETYVRILP